MPMPPRWSRSRSPETVGHRGRTPHSRWGHPQRHPARRSPQGGVPWRCSGRAREGPSVTDPSCEWRAWRGPATCGAHHLDVRAVTVDGLDAERGRVPVSANVLIQRCVRIRQLGEEGLQLGHHCGRAVGPARARHEGRPHLHFAPCGTCANSRSRSLRDRKRHAYISSGRTRRPRSAVCAAPAAPGPRWRECPLGSVVWPTSSLCRFAAGHHVKSLASTCHSPPLLPSCSILLHRTGPRGRRTQRGSSRVQSRCFRALVTPLARSSAPQSANHAFPPPGISHLRRSLLRLQRPAMSTTSWSSAAAS